jgi:hypothetical protein
VSSILQWTVCTVVSAGKLFLGCQLHDVSVAVTIDIVEIVAQCIHAILIFLPHKYTLKITPIHPWCTKFASHELFNHITIATCLEISEL